MADRLAGVSCEQCGATFDQKVQGRPARFCSTVCRNRWHNANPSTGPVRLSTEWIERVQDAADALVVSPRKLIEAALEQWFDAREIADASCESCGQPASVRLPDGSMWCKPCDASAENLGYDKVEAI